MGTATNILRGENLEISRMLGILDQMCRRSENGAGIEIMDVRNLLEYFRVIVDAIHNGKEENILFPALVNKGHDLKGGEIGITIEDHMRAHECLQEMLAALPAGGVEGLENLSPSFISAADLFLDTMRTDIERENEELFVMADQQLFEEEQGGLADAFKSFELEHIGLAEKEEFKENARELRRKYLDEAA